MKFRLLRIWLLFVGLTSAEAQIDKGGIVGKVLSQNNPAEFMNVALVGTTLGTTTDGNGNFR